jgi:hypothetical protein
MPERDVTRRDLPPDPLGKRALFSVPAAEGEHGDSVPATLPVGKRALYSGAAPRPDTDAPVPASANPLAERGAFSVDCERCGQKSRIGLVDLLILQLPIGVWLPRGRFDRRMTCPSCRRRGWCSVTLRRTAGVA